MVYISINYENHIFINICTCVHAYVHVIYFRDDTLSYVADHIHFTTKVSLPIENFKNAINENSLVEEYLASFKKTKHSQQSVFKERNDSFPVFCFCLSPIISIYLQSYRNQRVPNISSWHLLKFYYIIDTMLWAWKSLLTPHCYLVLCMFLSSQPWIP